MKAGVVIKRGDTQPAVQITCLGGDGQAVDLTGASARFLMKAEGASAPKVDRTADVHDAAAGLVWYAWQQGDTDTAGQFQAEVEITFGDGTKETFPAGDYIPILILADLG